MGFIEATPVQKLSIPVILGGRDLIACAQTGTGKTAAFLIPVIHDILNHPSGMTNTLVIVPTRELTVQIDQQLQGLGYYASISSKPVYGGGDGSDWELEKAALTRGCDVIIGTPGKLLQHLLMGYVKLDGLRHLILDEADRMLDMGFYEDIMRIISFLPPTRQNLLFSATMPSNIRQLARQILRDPEEINLAPAKPAEGVIQAAYLVRDTDKNELIRLLIGDKPIESILIFAATKASVKNLEKSLSGITTLKVRAMHSDLDQKKREETLNGFKNRQFEILVATDIMSRGIDIEKIDLVINYNVPRDAEDYVHRVGRTARAEKTGLAITLINPKEREAFRRIEKLIGKEIYKLKLPDGMKETVPQHTIPQLNSNKRKRN